MRLSNIFLGIKALLYHKEKSWVVLNLMDLESLIPAQRKSNIRNQFVQAKVSFYLPCFTAYAGQCMGLFIQPTVKSPSSIFAYSIHQLLKETEQVPLVFVSKCLT
ncbi:hypothetical protein NC653_015587 [Populus alba x Populus x berolinensis]|uniref:Uncharacterized protein n=1 Tax=Populus alba x Populus x berolinensis TaxID=444605 RepID=A0AAD6VYD8_9ROSI|nr:hypothetical protein NC653_015587 [Populus alba x Populus x berolinensis]